MSDKRAELDLTADGNYFKLRVCDGTVELTVELTEDELDSLLDAGVEVYNHDRPRLAVPLTQHGAPSSDEAKMLADLLKVESGLTTFEVEFVQKMSQRQSFTPRERDKIRQIHRSRR